MEAIPKRRPATRHAQHSRKATLDQYMALEARSVRKHEFLNGEIRLVPYTSEHHGLLVSNMIGLLGTSLRGTNCRVYPSDRMLYVPPMDNYFYPDVMVVCGESQFHTYKGSMQATTNPTTLIEVLSVSTKGYDEQTKWWNYRHLESLQQYMFVAQDEYRIELYTRVGNSNDWLNTLVTEPGQSLTVNGCVFTAEQVYEHVKFLR